MEIKKILLRALEFIFIGCVLSLICMACLLIFDSPYMLTILASVVANVAFFVIISIRLKMHRLEVPDVQTYYKQNLPAMAIYCLFALTVAFVLRTLMINQPKSGATELFKYIYTFLFFNFKTIGFYTYTNLQLSQSASAIIHTAICMVWTFVVPVVVMKDRERLEYMRENSILEEFREFEEQNAQNYNEEDRY